MRAAAELLRRQEELERKAAELDRREREMQSLNTSGGWHQPSYNIQCFHIKTLLSFVRPKSSNKILAKSFKHVSPLSPVSGRKNNWPPLPEKFPVGPCFYHDITVDIPVDFQKTVKIMYYIWMCE